MVTKEEALAKLKETLAARIAQAMEAMTGNPQRCDLIDDATLPPEASKEGALLGWHADYSGDEGLQLCIFASSEDWRHIGKAILEAAGVEEQFDSAIESTYAETLAQAASSWTQDLSGLAGRRWEFDTSGVGAEFSPGASGWGYRLPIGEDQATVWAQVSPSILSFLLEQSPTAEPSQAAEPAAAPSPSKSSNSQFDLLLDVELPVSVSFGRALVPLKEVLKLSSGSIVELNRAVTEPVEVIVNNCVIARGEVVVVEGNYGVRIQQIISRQDRLRTVN